MSLIPQSNANTDHAEWNRAWEHRLAIIYWNGIEKGGSLASTMQAENLAALAKLQPHTRLSCMTQTKSLYILQKDLASFAVPKFTVDNMEEKWKGLAQRKREELVLEGIWKAAHIGPDLGRYRQWCPEITVKNLAGSTGNGFLQLVQKLMPADLENELTEPLMIPNPIVDVLFDAGGDSNLVDCFNVFRVSRCYFITMTLWQIMLTLYGKEEEYIIAKPHRQSSANTKQLLRDAVNLMGRDAKEFCRIRDEHANGLHDAVNVCTNCQKDVSHLEIGTRLRACVKCKGIGRIIRYCSRECQVQDWKEGLPITHKQICGKTLLDDDYSSLVTKKPNETTDERIPPPDSSFKRSPALLHQISFLRRKPYSDYVFMSPPPHDDQGFSFPASFEKLLFLVMRRRALQNGDRGAVQTMFLQLAPYATGPGVSLSTFKKQLLSEYGVDIKSKRDFIDSPPPTDEELDIADRIISELSMKN